MSTDSLIPGYLFIVELGLGRPAHMKQGVKATEAPSGALQPGAFPPYSSLVLWELGR
jgi:hypothetical protein